MIRPFHSYFFFVNSSRIEKEENFYRERDKNSNNIRNIRWGMKIINEIMPAINNNCERVQWRE